MPAPKNITGQRFGRLVAVSHVGSNAHGQRIWRYLCDCGTQKDVVANSVACGSTTSCGCYQKEVLTQISRSTRAKAAEKTTRHGAAKRSGYSMEYQVWSGIKERCLNPNSPAYPNYGGRGITVVDRWHAYESFIADMGPRPSRDHSIDRIDNDGPYSPENCRWATRKEQRANQRARKCAVWVELGGERKTLDDWSRITGIRYGTLYARVVVRKWDAQRAIETPTRAQR